MKILILSCNTGEGHNSAAYAIYEALQEINVECEVMDALRFAGEKSSAIVESSFNSILVHAPTVFGLVYKAGDLYSATKLTSPVYLVNALYAKRLYEYISGNAFDAVICTHLFPMEAMTYIRRKCALNAKCYAVLTDYTCIPFLEETKMDAYLLPHDSVVAECIKSGIPKYRLFVTGLPVAKRFINRMKKPDARNYLVIPANRKMYLIMTGGIGCGNILELCNEILRGEDRDDDTSVYVLAGRNSDLKGSIEKRYKNDDRIQAITFTEKVDIYMSAADVLLSKPGGISSTEASAVNVPLVHTMAIPGCETKNAEFFAAHGMSLYAENAKEAAQYADLLIRDKNRAKEMLAAQREHIDPHGAEYIAELVSRP